MSIRIGELLVAAGRIEARQLRLVQAFLPADGRGLDAALVRAGWVTDDDIAAVLSEQFGLPAVSLENVAIAEDVAALIPGETAWKHRVVLLSRHDDTVTVAVADPTDFFALDDIMLLTGCELELMVTSEHSIDVTLERIYGPEPKPELHAIEQETQALEEIGCEFAGDDGGSFELGSSAPMPMELAQPEAERVEFSAYFPTTLTEDTWATLLVYAHLPSARQQVQQDSEQSFRGEASRPGNSLVASKLEIRRGAEIEVVPSMTGCEFNPPRASILWFEDWHRVSFRMRALAGEQYRTGTVRLYVGPVLVGEIPMWADVGRAAVAAGDVSVNRRGPYQAIFVSYSRQDATVIAALERAYQVLGLDYIRDVHELRSGQNWNDKLLEKIGAADVFQLCWSKAAAASTHVEREWRHAFNLGRSDFIRPVYWETPMPPPPAELAPLHFARLEWI